MRLTEHERETAAHHAGGATRLLAGAENHSAVSLGWPTVVPMLDRGAGDLLLAHYLLGHNIGGNTSQAVRCAVYFRIKRAGHGPRWREFLQDPWFDHDAVRERLE